MYRSYRTNRPYRLQPQTSIRNRGNQPLTLDQIQRVAPSVFATEPWGEVSNRYTFIPTLAVVEALQRQGFEPYSASQSLTRIDGKRNFAKHMIRFRHPSLTPTNVGDVFAELVMVNGHDTSSAYKLMGGLFRLTCLNGATVADSAVASISVRHQGNVIEEAARGSIEIVDHMPEVMRVVSGWRQLELKQPERLLLAEAAHAVRFADSEGKTTTPITPDQLLTVRRGADAGNDLWSTFNVIQENITKGGLTAYNATTQRYNRTREVKGIDQDIRLNRSLWALATKMAELKTA